ncbi:MAG TPA: lamin tail domain-containing protein, partial [Candidatus Paceibacterota bacterium]|nr:lamin tail domain-containing protein [Candidatus Paceibacterota bacterium]
MSVVVITNSPWSGITVSNRAPSNSFLPEAAQFLRFGLLAFGMLLGCFSGIRLVAQELLITEFMAINDGGLKDEDGQAMDWIEICNPGGQAADLTGWYLSDEPSRLTKWQFPAR